MNHIFYLHSNTCVISSYDVISQLLSRNERVIIVSERNTKFPFFEGQVALYDMQETIDKYRNNTHNVFLLAINYKTSLMPHCEEVAKSIIDEQDFIFYTPSYNMYSVKPFLNSKYCRGYYFIEEGFMAYLSEETLRKHYRNRRYKQLHFLMDFIGAGESYDYYVKEGYMGCYGLTDYSFPWCTNNRVVTSFDGYFSNLKIENTDFDCLITTDWLKDDIDILIKAFIATVKEIINNYSPSKVAIKFHPTAFINEKEKIDLILTEIRSEFGFIDFVILPSSFSIEALMYQKIIKLYCIFGLSSLQLYALMLKSKPFMVTKEGKIEIKEIDNIPEFVDLATKDWNG